MLTRRGFLAAGALAPFSPNLLKANAPTKLLLDTDIGSDIDDAVALSYLLRNPDCQLMGITTVTGDAINKNVDADRFFEEYFRVFPDAVNAVIPSQTEKES